MSRKGGGPILGEELHEVTGAVFLGGTAKGQRIDRLIIVAHEQLIDEGGVAQLVLSDAAEREVLFKKWGHANPFGVLLTHQVFVIGERQ